MKILELPPSTRVAVSLMGEMPGRKMLKKKRLHNMLSNCVQLVVCGSVALSVYLRQRSFRAWSGAPIIFWSSDLKIRAKCSNHNKCFNSLFFRRLHNDDWWGTFSHYLNGRNSYTQYSSVSGLIVQKFTIFICSFGFKAYLIFVIFFTRAKFLENKIYTEIYTVNCQFTQ